jgi:hypothetical protein
MLKSQDLVVACVLMLHPARAWSYAALAEATCLSQSAVFRALERLRSSQLVAPGGFRVFDERLLRLVEHGVPYVYAVAPGKLARGMPTAHSAAPLNEHISASRALVWPTAKGTLRGESVAPLAPSAPQAAEKDPALYRVLALIDAIRMGRPREQQLAVRLLKEEVSHARNIPSAG